MGRYLLIITPLFILFFLSSLTSFAASPTKSNSTELKKTITIGTYFAGESFTYKVKFWFFDNLARANINLVKNKDATYTATLSAKTTGTAAWFQQRTDTYTAILEEIDGARRFRTLSFEAYSKIGKKERRRITTFDYKNKLMSWKRWKKGRVDESEALPILEGGNYDGPLTAFYNFRFGAYGEIKRGSDFTIRTFPKKGRDDLEILINLATKDKFNKKILRRYPDGYKGLVKLDKGLFGSKSGNVELFFDKDMTPLTVVAKDIMLFGDVAGRLISVQPPKP